MSSNPEAPSYSRHRIASVFIVFGILVLLSGLVVNPWAGSLYRGEIINYSDVMLNYFVSSMVIGVLILACGFLIRRFEAKWIGGLSVLILVLSTIVLSDRLLLARYGLPLWMPDEQNHYKHRPGVTRMWNRKYGGKLIHINQHGHHDDEFPVEKPEGEFRGVVIGDSVAMGDGVTRDETFSNQLEDLLNQNHGNGRTFQIINTGVQGYSTFHQYNVLKDSLRFSPDLIAAQFCLNDLTEPLVVDTRYGGVGVDYHGVAQAPSRIFSYLLNETGYGRLVQRIRDSGKSVELERRWELYNTEKAALSTVDDPTFAQGWEITLSSFGNIYDLAGENNIPVVLLICPHTFQIAGDRYRNPQKILYAHARSKNVDVIDMTPVFEELIFDEKLAPLIESGASFDEIEELYSDRMRKYIFDHVHYTPEGHRVVAGKLYEYMSKKYSLGTAR
jgi:lysophospholipase L1-like esterase